jgi:hypothetical protein
MMPAAETSGGKQANCQSQTKRDCAQDWPLSSILVALKARAFERLFHYSASFAAIIIHPLRGLLSQIKPSLRPDQQTKLVG